MSENQNKQNTSKDSSAAEPVEAAAPTAQDSSVAGPGDVPVSERPEYQTIQVADGQPEPEVSVDNPNLPNEPVQTDNSARPEDGEQDVSQDS